MKRVLPIILAIATVSCQQASSQMTTRVVADNLFIPWEMVYGPDEHIWFTQKNGYICRLEPVGGVIDTIYHETNTAIQSEGGMLGMALHPDFATDPYVYVAYNYNQSGSYKERIVRYTYNGTVLTSPTTLLDNINGTNIHNGCRLAIVNDQLYITTGDAANQPIAQDVTAVNGKTLRINLDGSIPADNPVSGSAVWSWGHRNAQGLIYANNRFYSSEHGPGSDDELNILEKGRNYGWPEVLGYCDASEQAFCNDSNVVEPIIAWTPTLAVSAIAYYNHPMFPSLQNSILMTTLKDRKLYELELNSTYDDVTNSNVIAQVSGDRLRAICVDPDGRIYVSTSNSPASGIGNKIDKIIEIYDPTYSSIARQLKKANEQIAVYPNPAKDEINIYNNIPHSKGQYEFTIFNLSGQEISSGTLQPGHNKVPVSSLAAGAYLLKVFNGLEQVNSTQFRKL